MTKLYLIMFMIASVNVVCSIICYNYIKQLQDNVEFWKRKAIEYQNQNIEKLIKEQKNRNHENFKKFVEENP